MPCNPMQCHATQSHSLTGTHERTKLSDGNVLDRAKRMDVAAWYWRALHAEDGKGCGAREEEEFGLGGKWMD
jgi:hypothetical protein